MNDDIAALIIAGGGSARLGRPKQLVDWGGRPLLEHVIRMAWGWEPSSMTVVLGAYAEQILEEVDFGDADVVINPEWEEGMASSLRAGLDALSRTAHAQAALLALGDQPSISDEIVARVMSVYRSASRPAVVPKYRYTRGHPVLIDRSLWPRLMSLEGDQGARSLLQAHPDWVEEVWVDQLPPRDVDTAADVTELRPRA